LKEIKLLRQKMETYQNEIEEEKLNEIDIKIETLLKEYKLF
jgi:hypothetical protein